MNSNRRSTADKIIADIKTNGPATEAAIAHRLSMDRGNVRAVCTQLHRLREVTIQNNGLVRMPTSKESI